MPETLIAAALGLPWWSVLPGGAALLGLTPITRVSGLFAVVVGLMAAYWLLRVGLEARQGWHPRVAYWGVPGLALLLFAPVLEVPALFGIGAALLLLAEFWPGAFAPTSRKPGVAWPLVGVLVGAVLTFSIVRLGLDTPGSTLGATDQGLSVAAALMLLLAGAGGLVAHLLVPDRTARRLGFDVRWARVQIPEWPDLSVTLTERGAQVQNVSSRTLDLAGWSPASVNGWLRLRDEQGQPLNTLRAGQRAFVPLDGHESGIRVWYAQERRPGEPRLFRADWTPRAAADRRVLN